MADSLFEFIRAALKAREAASGVPIIYSGDPPPSGWSVYEFDPDAGHEVSKRSLEGLRPLVRPLEVDHVSFAWNPDAGEIEWVRIGALGVKLNVE